MTAQPVNFGINLTGISPSNGNLPFRDLAKMSQVLLLPWDFPIGITTGSERGSYISGTDLGMTNNNFTPGGSYGVEHDYSDDVWRVDQKKFGTTYAIDNGGSQVIRANYGTLENGRYCGWQGYLTSVTFGTDYMQFGADDDGFWTYTDANVYRKYDVESGTFEIWDGRSDQGGVKIREVTSATNNVAYADNFTSGTMAFYRKAGITSRMREVVSYVLGSDCTGFVFTLPSVIPEAVACPLTFNPDATWIARGSNISLSQNKAAGTGTVSLSANVASGGDRSLGYTGLRSGEKKWPANGIAMSVMLPSGSKYGTTGNWNPQHVSDLVKLGVKNLRNLDLSGANGGNLLRRLDNIYDGYSTRFHASLNPRLLAELCGLVGVTECKVCLPDLWTAAEKGRYLAELDQYLPTGCAIHAEESNEVWNFGNGSFGNMSYWGSLKGVGFNLEQADRHHETMSAWEAIGSSRPFHPSFGCQTGNVVSRYDEVIDRKANGGTTGLTLGQRFVQYNGRFTAGPYFGGGQGDSEITYASITAAAGSSASYDQYYAAWQAQHIAKQISSRQQHVDTWTALQARNVAKGFAATAIGLDIYEVNRHPQIYDTGDGINANLRNSYVDHQKSDALAQLQVLHLTEIATQVGGSISFFNGPVGRYNPINWPGYAGQGFWGIIWYTGEGTTGPGGVVNSTPSFTRIAAFGQSLLGGTPTPTPTPTPSPTSDVRYARRLSTLFA